VKTKNICTILLLCAALLRAEPFVLGADISWIPEREASGVRYAHNGQVKDILEILKDNKFNYIRLRLFVDPRAEVTEAMNESECKSGGWCSAPYSRAGYCGLDSTVKFAKRVKAAGFKFLLDFHYSDTWADPGKQYKPMSWRGLNSSQLTERVRSYTKESLEKFKENGVLPDMVQVGNEVVGGMIHPDGQGNTQNFAALVNAGIKGVKDVDTNILIMTHTINERNPNGWLTTLKSNLNRVEAGAANKIDVIGLSYYPKWHGNLDSLGRALKAIAKNHDIKIAVAEYADKHREVNDIVFALPDNKGFGTFVWEPEEFSGDDSKPIFDWKNNRRETNGIIALYPIMSKDFGNDDIDTSANDSSFVDTTATDSSLVDTTATDSSAIDSSSSINSNPRQPGADKKLREGVRVNRNGVINYYSDKPGRVTFYTVQGRAAGRFDVKSPGVYDPARLLRAPLRPGAYLIAVEPEGGKKLFYNSNIVK